MPAVSDKSEDPKAYPVEHNGHASAVPAICAIPAVINPIRRYDTNVSNEDIYADMPALDFEPIHTAAMIDTTSSVLALIASMPPPLEDGSCLDDDGPDENYSVMPPLEECEEEDYSDMPPMTRQLRVGSCA